MEFLSSAMLWGVCAAGLPLLIHLAGRAKPVIHRFPAIRFLQRSQRSSARALRVKHLLLLLLRMAILALLAFAFSRPLFPWRSSGMKGHRVGDFVLVIDASLSMQYRGLEEVRFEAARQAALDVLDRLADEARVALIRAGDEIEPVQGRLTLDHEAARVQIRELQPTFGALEVGRAVDAAWRILERDTLNRPRAIVLIGDLQASGFQRLAQYGMKRDERERPALILLDVGDPDAKNGAILSVRLPGASVPADETVKLHARIRPLTADRACPVDLYLDGIKVGQQLVDPKGQSEVEAQFVFPAGKPGMHSGWLELGHNDGLTADQRRHFTYRSGRPPRVLLVERRDGSQDRGTGFFLRAVLAAPSMVSATGLALQVCGPGELDATLLSQQRCVVVADAGALSDAAWNALETFVEEGGGLFFWLGPRTDPSTVRRHGFSDVARFHGLLPGRIGERATFASPLPVRVESPEHPLLARFPASVSALWQDLRVRSCVRVESDPKDRSVGIPLTIGERMPLALDKTYGRGRVLLCTLGPEDTDSDLVRQGEVFVTWVLEACRWLAHQDSEESIEVGRWVSRPLTDVPDDGLVTWFRPGTLEPRTIALEAPVDAEPGKALVRNRLVTPRLEQPGLHSFRWSSKAGVTCEFLFAVNVPARESDLARLSASDAIRALAPWPAAVVEDLDEAPLFRAESSGRCEFPALLLLLVLALAIAEGFLANRLYRQVEQVYEEPTRE